MKISAPLYDSIGVSYGGKRQPDPRIACRITAALDTAQSVLNVGAGTGNYEPTDREVIALDPSMEMLNQRPKGAAKAIQGVAEDLPFDDNSFDAVMAILTLHHWNDLEKGLQEMRRVARDRIVIMLFDPDHTRFWLTDYFPDLREIDLRWGVRPSQVAEVLGPSDVETIPIPHDVKDGFLAAYWRRPEAYLDPSVQAGISAFGFLKDLAGGREALRQDLNSGAWQQKYADILAMDSIDCGYRLVTVTL